MASSTQTRRGCQPWTLLGCGCGLLGMLGILLVFFALGIYYAHERHDPTWNRRDFNACQEHLKYLSKAIAIFERDNHRLPKSLNELQPRYLISIEMIHCPLEKTRKAASYQYNPAAKNRTDALVTCDNHGQATLALQRGGLLRLRSKLFRPQKK